MENDVIIFTVKLLSILSALRHCRLWCTLHVAPDQRVALVIRLQCQVMPAPREADAQSSSELES